jgi:PAS domain S-box-containing protein
MVMPRVDEIIKQNLFDDLPTSFMILDRDFHIVDVNKSWLDVTHQIREHVIGTNIFALFPESDTRIKIFQDAFALAFSGRINTVEAVPFSIPDPDVTGGISQRWWTCKHVPIVKTDGGIDFIMQHALDVTEGVKAQHFKEVISGELQHRVGNLLTLILSIARRSADNSTDLATFMEKFEARIMALSKTQSMLTGGNWDGTTIRELAQKQLEIYTDQDDGKIVIEGPELKLSAVEAQAVSMALHELATNAAKYGALKFPNGRLKIKWNTIEKNGFDLVWDEVGMEGINQPEKAGFGSFILTKILPSQLNGTAERKFTPTGHSYNLTVTERQSPLGQRIAALAVA